MQIWETAGALAVIIAGTLLHSLYHYTDYWLFALISPVNESVWEHLKIGIMPVFLFALIEYAFVKGSVRNFLTAKVAQAYVTSILIIAIFYLYTAVIGHHLLAVDILTFIIAVIAGQYLGYKIMSRDELDDLIGQAAMFGLYLMIGSVLYATYFPPHYPMFLDPVSGKYGMPAKRGMIENILFISKNTLLAILTILVAFFIMNFLTPFKIWSINRKLDKVVSLLEKIAKK